MTTVTICRLQQRIQQACARSASWNCGLFAALALSGCTTTYPSTQPPGPPAAWVQLSTPVSAAPVEYDRRTAAVPPVLELQATMPRDFEPTAPFELQPSEPTPSIGPDAPAPEPGMIRQTPPLAPGADLPRLPEPASTVPPTADMLVGAVAPSEPALKQSTLEELSGQLAALDRRVNEQAAALEQARVESDAARRATQRLQTEFINWRAELDVVRDTIQAQSAADVRALDELSQALEVLLNSAPTPPSPGNVEHAQPATRTRFNRATR